MSQVLKLIPNDGKLRFSRGSNGTEPWTARLHVENTANKYVIYRIRATYPDLFKVNPNVGVLAPEGTSGRVLINISVLRRVHDSIQTSDKNPYKFQIQSVFHPEPEEIQDFPEFKATEIWKYPDFAAWFKIMASVFTCRFESPLATPPTVSRGSVTQKGGVSTVHDYKKVSLVGPSLSNHDADSKRRQLMKQEAASTLDQFRSIKNYPSSMDSKRAEPSISKGKSKKGRFFRWLRKKPQTAISARSSDSMLVSTKSKKGDPGRSRRGRRQSAQHQRSIASVTANKPDLSDKPAPLDPAKKIGSGSNLTDELSYKLVPTLLSKSSNLAEPPWNQPRASSPDIMNPNVITPPSLHHRTKKQKRPSGV